MPTPTDRESRATHGAIRQLFPGTSDVCYLNTATLALGADPVRSAYDRALNAWQEGRFDWSDAERAGERARARFARLIGATADEIAIVPTVSAAAGVVSIQLGSARSGDNIVVGSHEFTSNLFPWLALRDRGYELRLVPFERGAPSMDAFAERIDAHTRLVAASAVQSASGAAADIGALGELAHERGAWLFVDACQAAGAVTLDGTADRVDFLAAASHKFLCGTRGMGYLYVSRDLVPRMRAVGPGWKAAKEPAKIFYGPAMDLSDTASRLDFSLPWFAALGDNAALDMIGQFADGWFAANVGFVRRLREGLAVNGFEVAPPDAPVSSTIVSVEVIDADALIERFRDARVVAAGRAGRVRLSIHAYNSNDEIDLVVDLMKGTRRV